MKEIMIIHHFGGIGGAGVSLLDIIDSLQNDFKITVVCPNNPDSMLNELKKRSIKVIEIQRIGFLNYHSGGATSVLAPSSIIQLLKIFMSYLTINSLIKNYSGNLIMINSMTLSWIGPLLKKHDKLGICFDRETFSEENKLGTKILKYFMGNYFIKIIFISKFDLFHSSNIINEKKRVIYDRVHKEKFRTVTDKRIRNDRKKILFLGGFSELKGAHVIVGAMKYLKDYPYDLIFIGETNILKPANKVSNFIIRKNYEYKRMILDDIYNNSIKNIEFKNKTLNPQNLYKEADLLVFPSTKPHQARPIYEAGFSRIPIIITNFVQTQEFIQDYKNGFTFNNEDSRDLANKIIEVLNMESNKLREIVENNYTQTCLNHDFDMLRNDLLNILEEL